MESKVIDFRDESMAASTIQELVRGAKSRTEIADRLKNHVIKPEPGKLYHVTATENGFSLLFLVGRGERPRVVHCTEENFDEFA